MRNETFQESVQNAGSRIKVSKDISTDPPIGGWNTRDDVDSIPSEDATLLDNWTCGLGAVHVRKGFVEHSYSYKATDHTAEAVKTLMKYDAGGTTHLFAADAGAVWDATAPGPGEFTTPAALTGMTSDVWSWTNFRGGAAPVGGYLVAVNGTEFKTFDGTDWDDLSLTGPATVKPFGCFAFKNRMYYWEVDSQSIWYTELYAVGGAITEFQIGDIGQFGGSITSIESVTHDGGHGTDDYLLVIMSGGETIAYQGSYPADEADWALVGIYNPGLPMGPRSFAKFGGDLYMMTDLDILPMSKLLSGVEATADLTKISGAMQAAAPRRGAFGFDVQLFPPNKLMIFNVPTGNNFDQFVMNTVTGAWSRWKDIKAYCWIEYQGDLYFGTDNGVVYKAENGNYDSELILDTTGIEDGPGEQYTYEYTTSSQLVSSQNGHGLLNVRDYPTSLPDFDASIRVNTIDYNGIDRTNEIEAIEVGDTVSVIGSINGTGVGTVHWVSMYLYPETDQHYAAIYVLTTAGDFLSFENGESVILDLSAATPPQPGAVRNFSVNSIKSDVQTSWLRFGVEENKQFDAVKIFFTADAVVNKAIGLAVDYAEIPQFGYPKDSVGVGTPWSGEWVPPPTPPTGMPDEIPDPTTWWTDESRPGGRNPPVPVNDATLLGGVDAVTPWSIEATTSERWDIIAGYGRAISLLMKLSTKIQVAWNLTLWHTKIGTGM